MEKADTNSKRDDRWAPLSNLLLCARAVDRAMNRPAYLPGLVCFYGPSGWGKSVAALYSSNKFEGIHVQFRSHFTKKAFVLAILKEMRLRPQRTLTEMMDQAAEELQLSRKPLFIDEGDHIVDRNAIEILRDLHDMSRCAMVLIGEERFPQKLARWQQFHNRVLVWQPAQPASMDDARKLAAFYCPDVEISDDLLVRVREMSKGAARRICVNLDAIRDYCQKAGFRKIDLEGWGLRDFYTGDAPVRRVA